VDNAVSRGMARVPSSAVDLISCQPQDGEPLYVLRTDAAFRQPISWPRVLQHKYWELSPCAVMSSTAPSCDISYEVEADGVGYIRLDPVPSVHVLFDLLLSIRPITR
jgi:hypothetical protein